jgi:hypothetical protein
MRNLDYIKYISHYKIWILKFPRRNYMWFDFRKSANSKKTEYTTTNLNFFKRALWDQLDLLEGCSVAESVEATKYVYTYNFYLYILIFVLNKKLTA